MKERLSPLIQRLALTISASLMLFTLLTALLVYQNQYMEQRSLQTRIIREQSLVLYNEISVLMDTRLTAWRRVAWAIEESRDSAEIWRLYDAYTLVIERWNNSLNRHRTLLCRHFGSAIASVFHNSIRHEFVELQQQLRQHLGRGKNARNASIGRKPKFSLIAEHLNTQINRFNHSLSVAMDSPLSSAPQTDTACANFRDSRQDAF